MALTQAQIEARRQRVRDLINSAGSTFLSVRFVKRTDNTVRLMNIQLPAIQKHIVGDAASESAKQAVQTRAMRHPSLLNVYDVVKKGIRSLDLDRVTDVTVHGVGYHIGEAVSD